MATVDDLKAMGEEPNTIDDWLERFTEEEKIVVQDAMLRHSPKRIFEIITELEDNPYPFSLSSISNWRRR